MFGARAARHDLASGGAYRRTEEEATDDPIAAVDAARGLCLDGDRRARRRVREGGRPLAAFRGREGLMEWNGSRGPAGSPRWWRWVKRLWRRLTRRGVGYDGSTRLALAPATPAVGTQEAATPLG